MDIWNLMVHLLDVFVINISNEYNLKVNSCLDKIFQTGILIFHKDLLFALFVKICINILLCINCKYIMYYFYFFDSGKYIYNYSFGQLTFE